MEEIAKLLDKRAAICKKIESLEFERFELREELECCSIDRVKIIGEIDGINEKLEVLETEKDDLLSKARYLADEKGVTRRELHQMIKEVKKRKG